MRNLEFQLTLPMLRLLKSKAQECKDFSKPPKPCHGGIHYQAMAEYYQMSTHMIWFKSFSVVVVFFALLRTGQISHQQYKG